MYLVFFFLSYQAAVGRAVGNCSEGIDGQCGGCRDGGYAWMMWRATAGNRAEKERGCHASPRRNGPAPETDKTPTSPVQWETGTRFGTPDAISLSAAAYPVFWRRPPWWCHDSSSRTVVPCLDDCVLPTGYIHRRTNHPHGTTLWPPASPRPDTPNPGGRHPLLRHLSQQASARCQCPAVC